MMIRLIYTVFLGLLLALFVGMGIAAFYPAPKAPEYTTLLSEPKVAPVTGTTVSEQESAEQKIARQDYDKQQKEFQEKSKTYNRNVSVIALGFAIIMLIVSLVAMQSIDVIADGILLGGVFNLLYSIIRGFMTDDTRYQFTIVTIGLITAFVLGYFKFIRPQPKH